MGIIRKIETALAGSPTHATLLYQDRDGQPIGIAGMSRARGAAEQLAEITNELYYANGRGDFGAFHGANYAGTVLISELTPAQREHLPA